ncbi:MAG: ABC transporter permease subunit [Planctomycetota bacterium]|nr:ABC transporter permease subunit [Planctomycetota bacterium]MDA1106471.1 ABC transporter permease subunit [Planctomycetota bacterium]
MTLVRRLWSTAWPPLALLVLLALAWEVIDAIFDIPTYLLPTPLESLEAMVQNGTMFARATLFTAIAALGGLALSAVLGVLVGSVIASSRVLTRSAYPIATLLQMVPLVAIAPLLVIWCGYGLRTSLASAVIVSIFPVIANTVDGLRSTDPQWKELFDLYRIRGWNRWRKLLFPAALPNIVTGLRIASGLAVIGAIVGEFVGGYIGDNAPLGSIIMSSLRQSRTDMVFAAIVLGAGVGFVLFGIVSLVGTLTLHRWHASARSLLLAAAALLALTGCNDSQPAGSGVSPGGTAAAKPLTVQLNWVPEPEFGGLYAGVQSGAFASLGRPVELISGGAALATPQLLAQGVCDIALVGGDQIVTARAQGADIVGVFATFVESPYGIMAHASNPADSLEALWTGGGTIAVEDGLPYVRVLFATLGNDRAKFVPYAGSMAPFEADPTSAQQIFITAEPVELSLKGVPVKVFSVAPYFNPYVAVYAVRGETLRTTPDTVWAFVAALRTGWQEYLADPAKFNPAIAAKNPSMSLEAMNLAGEAERPLIQPPGMSSESLGTMTLQRWTETIQGMESLGIVPKGKVSAPDCFANAPASSPPSN